MRRRVKIGEVERLARRVDKLGEVIETIALDVGRLEEAAKGLKWEIVRTDHAGVETRLMLYDARPQQEMHYYDSLILRCERFSYHPAPGDAVVLRPVQ